MMTFPRLWFVIVLLGGASDLKAENMTWTTEPVDTNDVFYFTDLEVDINGHPHIAYIRGHEIWYATLLDSIWTTELADPPDSWERPAVSLAIDREGFAHILYFSQAPYDPDGLDSDKLIYLSNRTGAWRRQVLYSRTGDKYGSSFRFPRIAVANDGTVGLAFHFAGEYVSFGIYYTWKASPDSGAPWQPWELAKAMNDPPYAMALRFDPWSIPHIAFHNAASGQDLWYATKAPSWTSEIVASIGWIGWGADLAVDSTGAPHLSYTSRPSNTLFHARKQSGQWLIETVTENLAFVNNTSIQVDRSNNPRISYRIAENPCLRYIAKATGIWSVSVIDSVGGGPSLGLDNAGRPHVAYQNSGVMYATVVRADIPEETGVSRDFGPVPHVRILPNPARPGQAQISFMGLHGTENDVNIFDVSGRRVRTLGRIRSDSSVTTMTWDARDDQGRAVGPGVYLIRVNAGRASWAGRMSLVR